MKKILKMLITMALVFSGMQLFGDLTKDEQALFSAANKDNIEAVQKLIDKGVNINIKNEVGMPPLYVTIRTLNDMYSLYDDLYGTDTEDKGIDKAITVLLLINDANFDINDDTYLLASKIALQGNVIFKDMLDEILAYKKNSTGMVAKKDALALAITNNGKNDSAFTKEEWLHLALLSKHVPQIQYCVNNKIFTPSKVLEIIAQHPRMPLDPFEWLWNRVDDDQKNDVKTIAEKRKNEKFLEAIMRYNLYKTKSKTIEKDINIF